MKLIAIPLIFIGLLLLCIFDYLTRVNWKKTLMTIPLFLLWILYFIITLDERNRYLMGQSRGCHCYQSKDVSRFIYGSVTEYSYYRNIPPIREYTSWRQWWKNRGYYNESK